MSEKKGQGKYYVVLGITLSLMGANLVLFGANVYLGLHNLFVWPICEIENMDE